MVSMCFLSNSKLDYFNYKKITIILFEKVHNCILLTTYFSLSCIFFVIRYFFFI